ncbi:MAG: pyridoxamine 5'-phosphate oxidase [Pseudomonadota bacterium]
MTKQLQLPENPYDLFKEWLTMAEESEPNDPNAMCLATTSKDGYPNARMVLLKGLDERGFVFYTNAESRKGQELDDNDYAALCFHWKSLRKQVRVQGKVVEIDSEEADQYYATRHRGSRIGAWASKQSRPLESMKHFEDFLERYEKEFEGIDDIPRPDYWKGFRVIPDKIEFWVDGEYRLHQRYVYTATGEGQWKTGMLYP